MAEKVKLRIPAIVTADRKWAANGSHALLEDPDWSWIDEMCDHENPTICPRRFWIEVEVDLPEIETVAGTTTTER